MALGSQDLLGLHPGQTHSSDCSSKGVFMPSHGPPLSPSWATSLPCSRPCARETLPHCHCPDAGLAWRPCRACSQAQGGGRASMTGRLRAHSVPQSQASGARPVELGAPPHAGSRQHTLLLRRSLSIGQPGRGAAEGWAYLQRASGGSAQVGVWAGQVPGSHLCCSPSCLPSLPGQAPSCPGCPGGRGAGCSGSPDKHELCGL